jgi:hypothetical protein
MYVLKVLKAEGTEYDAGLLGCYISHNSILQDIITPLTPEHSVLVPLEGQMKIIIKTMCENSEVLGSVAFPLESVNKDTMWLPISGENTLESIPENPDSPRIQISLELTENSCELSPESHIISISDEENDWSRLRLQLKMQNFSLQEMTSEVQTNKSKLKLEMDSKILLETKLHETQKEYSLFVSQAQRREQSMLTLLEQKDLEIAESINQTLKVQGYLDRLLEDKRHVEEKLACLKTVTSNEETESLRTQITSLRAQLAQEDKRRQELRDMLLQIGKEWRETEDQEKINNENKLIKTEQEVLRAKGAIQSLQLDLEKEKNACDKIAYDLKVARQDCTKLQDEKKECENELQELKQNLNSFSATNADLEISLKQLRDQIETSERNNIILDQNLSKLKTDYETIAKQNSELTEALQSEKKNNEKILEKIQQEKLYSERLNELVIQERLNSEKIKDECQGPDLETLIDEIFQSLRLEKNLIKADGCYMYENSEIHLVRRVEYFVDVKTSSGIVPLAEFLLCPRTPCLRNRVSQDSKIENELDSIGSYCSTDKEKLLFSEKHDKKAKTNKSFSKNFMKLPLKEKNTRLESLSVERRRPFK